MKTADLRTGLIVYKNGHGITIVVGKKTATIGGQQINTWELRALNNIGVSISVPQGRTETSGLRHFFDRDGLSESLALLANRKQHFKNSLKHNTDNLDDLINSGNPKDIAFAIRKIFHTYNIKNKSMNTAQQKIAELAKRAITLLAEDLSMASGLSIPAARDHIFDLVLAERAIDVWPIQAKAAKSNIIDADVFEEVFQITLAQADDLNRYPPIITLRGGAQNGNKSTTQEIINFLERESAAKISKAVKSFLPSHEGKQVYFQEIIPLATQWGSSREAIQFALTHLSDANEFYALSAYFLVRENARMSLPEIAQKLNIPETDMKDILDSAIKNFKDSAQLKRETSLLSLITKKMETIKMGAETKNAERGSLYEESSALVADKGFNRYMFSFAADALTDEQLNLMTHKFFAKYENRKTDEQLAELYGITSAELAKRTQDSILALTRKAVETDKHSYITRDMLEMCPEAMSLFEGGKKARQTSSSFARASKRDKEDLVDLIQAETGNMPGAGFNALLYKIARQNFTREMFAVYIPSDLRIKNFRETLKDVAQRLGISLEQAKIIRNQAIHLLETQILKSGIEKPKSKFKALIPSTLSRSATNQNTATPVHEFTETDNCSEEEESLYNNMRSHGYDGATLSALAFIHEQRGDIVHALYLYGAASDLSESEDETIAQGLQRLENENGYKYDSETHFPLIESYLQDRLNGATESVNIKNEFNNPKSEHEEDVVIDAEFVEVEKVQPSQTEGVRGSRDSISPQPRPSFSLPPEIFRSGQKLVMTFNDVGGGLAVTLELKPSDGTETRARGPSAEIYTEDGIDVTFGSRSDSSHGSAHINKNALG